MEKKIGVFTIFTFLLFAVSTARIFDQVIVLTDGVSKSSPESVAVADSDIVLPNEKPKSEFDETTANDRLQEIEKTQTLSIDPTQRLNFARLHPIKRHVFDKTTRIPLRFVRRHPCRKFEKTFMIPRTERSYGDDMISSDKAYNFDPKTLGDQVPTKWLEFKHNYGHHHNHHNHHDHHNDKEEEFVPKYMFDREKMLHSSRHHKEKRENNGGFNFMKRIRKFLKHTFD
ncbi:hypothetical protein Ccrd_002591 [Cynara cardunculus var. scolymus]|uniref:Uncharacterized protein n=1 Tax=Cynara cardunculus var. scolymus TaxID=59895 RepID=A0A103XR46_CYNCS|nr:hypothetical protein Ccrd_002591 [Cynara cardunculus var. scolymus]